MANNTWNIQGTLGEYQVIHQDGQYFIRYRDGKIKNAGYLPLTSERDPEKEAKRILGNFVLKKGLLAIVIGAASLKLIDLLKAQQLASGGEILIFDADDKFVAGIKKIMPDFLDNLNIFGSENEHVLRSYIESLPIEELLGFRILPVARSFQISPDFYSRQENIFKSVFSTRFSDLLTRIEFEGKWILNSFLNLEACLEAVPVKAMINSAAGENALLVSSGPSLRESLHWIKENKDRYFIACVDSAYRVLHRSGITPHLVFSLDSQIYTYRHFQGLPQGERGKYPVLYMDLVCNPWITRNWKGNIIAGITAHYSETHRVITPGCDFIEDNLLDEPCGDIQSGGSVATSLFDLLRNMNFQTITLVGQDLAFTNREIHCTGTHHTDMWISKNLNRLESLENINFRVLKKRQIVWSTSIRGNALPEDFIFSIYRKWFEEAVETVPNQIFNATADGAHIRGTKKPVLPKKPVSENLMNNFSGLVFNKKNPLIQKEKLIEFYKSILQGNPFDRNEDQPNYTFLERIGKKYYIKYLRTQLRGNQNTQQKEEVYLNLQLREKKMFWNFLKKRISGTLNKLQI